MLSLEKLIQDETRRSFDYFWQEANTDPNSPGYGLIRDHNTKEDFASIAAVGFGLAAIVIGVERQWISREEGEERVRGTLETFWHRAEHADGFFYHFLDMETAKKYQPFYDCASIIDTALLVAGAFTAGEYFGGEIAQLSDQIYRRIDWTVYVNDETNQFYMGYDPARGKWGHWDIYSEQLMLYPLAVASPTHPVAEEIYAGFDRVKGSYGDLEFYNSIGGPLFTHQFSHAWIDFRHLIDKDGINWFENSILASKAQYQYAKDNPFGFKTYRGEAWGLTASAGPNGYRAYGVSSFYKPGDQSNEDGTVAPCASVGSIVFTPDETMAAMKHFYEEVPGLWGEYGFADAYNEDVSPMWVADHYIGIDKGISVVMLENYQSGLIWDLFMKNDYVQKGLRQLGFRGKLGSDD